MLFGVLAHKELGSFPARAANAAREIVLTSIGDRRSARPEELRELFIVNNTHAGRNHADVRAVRGMARAIASALKSLGPDDTLLILGSHLTVADAVGYL